MGKQEVRLKPIFKKKNCAWTCCLIESFWILWFSESVFTNSAPEGRVGLGVAMSVVLSVCLSVCAIESQGSKGGYRQNSTQLSNHIEQQLQRGAPGSWHWNGSEWSDPGLSLVKPPPLRIHRPSATCPSATRGALKTGGVAAERPSPTRWALKTGGG